MEGVYLIHTRECISIEKCVYKFGRSFTVSNRVKQYPQNSNVEFMMSCNNSVKCEKEILKLLRAKFKQASLYGSEYFEGDKHLMIEIIFNYINGKYNIVKPNVIENKKLESQNTIKQITKVENKKIVIINNDNLEERKCNKCNTVFKYSSYYKRHIENSSRCKIINNEIVNNEIVNNEIVNSEIDNNEIDNNEIDNNEIVNNKKNKIIECIYCKTTFSRKSVLKRHNIESRCGKTQEAKNIESKYGTEQLSIEQVLLLYPKKNNDLLEDISNKNNNYNHIINTIILPQIIYPFGSEDISFLNDTEILEILQSPTGNIIAIEKIYSKIENKNFYKQNLCKDNISYIDSNLDMKIYKRKDFQNKILYNSIDFMYRIYFKYNNKLTSDDKIFIINNINIIKNTNTNISNSILSILECDFMDKQRRDLIQKFNNKIQNNLSFKQEKLELLKDIKQELEQYYINKIQIIV